MLDEEKSCWMKIWSGTNFSCNIFRLIQQKFYVGSVYSLFYPASRSYGIISSVRISNDSTKLNTLQNNNKRITHIPTDIDVLKTSSGRLKKVMTSYDQTRRRQDVWKKTSDLWRLEDALFKSSWRRPIYDVLKTSDLRRLEYVWFKTSWRRPVYVVLMTSNLRRLKDVQFMTSWRRLICNVLRTSDLRCLEDVLFTSSWRRPLYDVLETSVKRRLCSNVVVTSINVKRNNFSLFCTVWNIQKILSVPV